MIEGRDRLFQIEPVGAQGHEIMRGIAGDRRRPLHLADFPRRIRRDRNSDVGEGEAVSALACFANIIPGGVKSSARVVATNMSTELAPGALVETATRLPLGRPAQPLSATAKTAAPANVKALLNSPPSLRCATLRQDRAKLETFPRRARKAAQTGRRWQNVMPVNAKTSAPC